MGTFYRSKHELVFIFKKGDAPTPTPLSSVSTADTAPTSGNTRGSIPFAPDGLTSWPCIRRSSRWRCWRTPSATSVGRGALVLDPFAGSGSTLIAAEKTGRQARCIEYAPNYCDVIVRRWQAYTGKTATFEDTGLTFEDFEASRSRTPVGPTPSIQH